MGVGVAPPPGAVSVGMLFAHIKANPRCTRKEMADHFHCPRSNLTPLLKELQAQGNVLFLQPESETHEKYWFTKDHTPRLGPRVVKAAKPIKVKANPMITRAWK